VGYWCRLSCQGQGYTTEAVRAIAGFAENMLGAKRVECFSDERSASSRRVAEKAGFVLEAIQTKTSSSGATHRYCRCVRVR
jgi:RimJ/RimL family protein N-acetyltransferase